MPSPARTAWLVVVLLLPVALLNYLDRQMLAAMDRVIITPTDPDHHFTRSDGVLEHLTQPRGPRIGERHRGINHRPAAQDRSQQYRPPGA